MGICRLTIRGLGAKSAAFDAHLANLKDRLAIAQALLTIVALVVAVPAIAARITAARWGIRRARGVSILQAGIEYRKASVIRDKRHGIGAIVHGHEATCGRSRRDAFFHRIQTQEGEKANRRRIGGLLIHPGAFGIGIGESLIGRLVRTGIVCGARACFLDLRRTYGQVLRQIERTEIDRERSSSRRGVFFIECFRLRQGYAFRLERR